MTISWIIIANASEAYIYTSPKARLLNGSADLKLVGEYSHPESRKKGADLISDKPGSYKSREAGRGKFIEPTDPKEHEAEQFAKELADILDTGRTSNNYEELILVAPPHFHGLLKRHMNNQVESLLTVSIEKDYTKANARDLMSHLIQHF